MERNVLISGFINANNETKKGCIAADIKSGIIKEVLFGEDISKLNNMDFCNKYDYDESYTIYRGDFNAHSHPEQSLYTELVDKSWDLGTWCRNTIYKYSTGLTPEKIYKGCKKAFTNMLSLGVTSVMVSFYCHNNRDNMLDNEVIRAAVDTGIRLYFGRMNYDVINEDAYEEKKSSQKSYYETVVKAEENFISLMKDTNFPNVVIAPSVHSIHASTKEAIINAINLGNKYNRYVQFHLSEDKGDVELSKKLYGMEPVKFLDSLYKSGQVQRLDNLILSDCVWVNEEERELIKKHNMKVVLNPRMNNRVKAGEANIPMMVIKGIELYLGTDGEASNDDLSITGERKFLQSKYDEIPSPIIDSIGNKDFKFNEGYIGDIKKGNYCDLKIIKDEKVENVFVGGKSCLS